MPRTRCCSASYREDEESSTDDSVVSTNNYTRTCTNSCNTCYKKEVKQRERQYSQCCTKPKLCNHHARKEKSKRDKCEDKKVIIITIS